MLVLCSLCWFRYRPRQQLDDHQRRRGLRVGQILPRGAYPRSCPPTTLTDGFLICALSTPFRIAT